MIIVKHHERCRQQCEEWKADNNFGDPHGKQLMLLINSSAGVDLMISIWQTIKKEQPIYLAIQYYMCMGAQKMSKQLRCQLVP